VVESFEVPPDETYAHALTARVNAVVQHIQSARPMSVSMGNAVKSLKTHLARMSEEHASARGDAAPVASGNVDHASDFESRRKTMAHLEYFEVEKIEKAGRSIAEHGANEISDGDVVATHGLSHHCFEILKEAKRRGKRFGVAVIDSRPNLEGQTQLRRLRAVGVECTYCQLTGLDHVLRKGKVTKVLLGAAAVLANGAVVSRCGAAVVAASAVEYKIPVLVAAETVKFHERVQLDAVAHNELGDPDLVAFGAAVGLETDGIGSTVTRGTTRAATKTKAATRRRIRPRCYLRRRTLVARRPPPPARSPRPSPAGVRTSVCPCSTSSTTARPRRACAPSCARAARWRPRTCRRS
jgi:translation initiation factor eIF-2B subunit delta